MSKFKDDDDECVMYIVVNSDLLSKMGKGKIASQCCHSACDVIQILEHNTPTCLAYKEWNKSGSVKIVLKATEKEMLKLLESYLWIYNRNEDVWCMSTCDFGRTQIPVDSLTTLAFRPMKRSQVPMCLKSLKLL